MMNFSVIDETSSLISVIIGIANNLGPKPKLKDLYDPKSIENLKSGNYPLSYQKNMREAELMCQEAILQVIRENMPVEKILN